MEAATEENIQDLPCHCHQLHLQQEVMYNYARILQILKLNKYAQKIYEEILDQFGDRVVCSVCQIANRVKESTNIKPGRQKTAKITDY